MTNDTSNRYNPTSTINDVQGEYKPAGTYTPSINNRTDGVVIPCYLRYGMGFRHYRTNWSKMAKSIAIRFSQKEYEEQMARLRFNRRQLR